MRTSYTFLSMAFCCVSAIAQEASVPNLAQVNFGELRELYEVLATKDQQLGDLHRQLAALDPTKDATRLKRIQVERDMLRSRMGSDSPNFTAPAPPPRPDYGGEPFQEERELLEKIEALNEQLAIVRQERLHALELEEKEIKDRQRARISKSIPIESQRISNQIRARERSIVMGIIGEHFKEDYSVIVDSQEANALLYARHEPVDITDAVKKKVIATYDK